MSGSTNIRQILIDSEMNAFGLELFVESFLKAPLITSGAMDKLDFVFPVQRSDCPDFKGVRIIIEPLKKEGAS